MTVTHCLLIQKVNGVVNTIICACFREPEKKKKVKLVTMPTADNDEVEEPSNEKEKTGKKSKNKFRVQHEEVSSTTQVAASTENFLATYTPRKYLVIRVGGKWQNHQVRYIYISFCMKSLSFFICMRFKIFYKSILYVKYKNSRHGSGRILLRQKHCR